MPRGGGPSAAGRISSADVAEHMTPGSRNHLSQALAELRAGHAAQGRAITALEMALEASLQQGLNALPEPIAPISEHRRTHRPGRIPKIDGDPEVQTFIAARIERLTFKEIATEVARHFPPARRVGKSAIHAWWKARHRRFARNLPDHTG